MTQARWISILPALLVSALVGIAASAQTTIQIGSPVPTPTPSTSTRVHKTIIKEVDGPGDDDYYETRPTPVKDAVLTTKFGSKGMTGTAGCKTEDQAKDVVKDLKGDCKAWVNDQKADLKDRYLTSACEESCEDCGSSLRRCGVTGTIHYLVR